MKVALKVKVHYESESAYIGMFQVEEGLLERAILHLADSLHPHHFLLSQVKLEYQTIGETCKNLPKVKLYTFKEKSV